MKPRFVLQVLYAIVKLIIPTCKYLIYSFKKPEIIKFLIPWVISNLNPRGNNIKDQTIWITFQSKEWIESFLTPDMNVFEYGSGGSTLFFQERVKFLVSVEHNHVWYQNLLHILKEKNISNCKYLLFEPQPFSNGSKDFSDPQMFASQEYPNMSFEAYVKSIDTFSDESFDLVFIDGRARPSCVFSSLNKVKPEGIIMMDNSERAHYHLSKNLLVNWEKTDFYGPGPYGRFFWNTTIWQKPVKII